MAKNFSTPSMKENTATAAIMVAMACSRCSRTDLKPPNSSLRRAAGAGHRAIAGTEPARRQRESAHERHDERGGVGHGLDEQHDDPGEAVGTCGLARAGVGDAPRRQQESR